MSTYLHFRRDGYKFAQIPFAHGEDLAEMKAFAQELSIYSCSPIDFVSVAVAESVEYGSQSSGPYDAISTSAEIWMRHLDNRKLYVVKIPSPQAFLFDQYQRVIPSEGRNIAALYKEHTGADCIFAHGALTGMKT